MTAVTPSSVRGRAGECSPPRRTGAAPRPARGYASGKDDYLARLRKIEGQVRGLQRMVEADTWCPDVLIQVASATRALQEVAVGLLGDHLRHPAPIASVIIGITVLLAVLGREGRHSGTRGPPPLSSWPVFPPGRRRQQGPAPGTTGRRPLPEAIPPCPAGLAQE